MSDEDTSDITSMTVQLLSAYLANNTVPSADLPDLISRTRAALQAPAETPAPEQVEVYEPAVTLRKSLASPDHIISMIDGKTYTMLTRHLARNGLTPAEYRARYNLPADYPMVARAYSEKRRALAKEFGLGRKPNEASAAQEPAPAPAEVLSPASAAPAKRVRKAKVAVAAPEEGQSSAPVQPAAAGKPEVATDVTVKPDRKAKAQAAPKAPAKAAAKADAKPRKGAAVSKSGADADPAASQAELPVEAAAPAVKPKRAARPKADKVVSDVEASAAAVAEAAPAPAAKKPKGASKPSTKPAGKAPATRRMARASEAAAAQAPVEG